FLSNFVFKIYFSAMTLEDIEDIYQNIDTTTNKNDNHSHEFKVKLNHRIYRKENEESNVVDDYNDDNSSIEPYQNFLPAKYSIYVHTWGCTHNSSDSEYMMGILAQNGYQIVQDKEKAQLWILNSCTVKTPAETQFRNEMKKALSKGKKLVLAGCVAQSDYRLPYLKSMSIIGVQQIDKVVEVVEETLKGNVVRYLTVRKKDGRKTGGASLHMPKIRRNPLIEIISINTGCLNECTYCKTKHARGKLGSYSIEDIVERAQTAFNENVKELWITSEDTGAYGKDIGKSLPELLDQLIKVVPNDCMIRVGMTNPPYILEHIESMARILSHPRVYSFLHIPVQSGSDQVLSDMKREYCIEDFCTIVDFLKQRVKGITIATDIICGFPTETENNFNETVSLVNKYRFPVLFINQFFPRPGTPAAKMKRVPTLEVKRRSRIISQLFNSYYPYNDRIGHKYRVLVTELSTDKKFFVGHNKFYEQILIAKHQCQLGEWIDVEIESVGKYHMMAKTLWRRWLMNRIRTTLLMGNANNDNDDQQK
ncbi:Threonylcarbamoyladenosine tRNA methylthiotransferase, partial [Dermatophagoides farinae]